MSKEENPPGCGKVRALCGNRQPWLGDNDDQEIRCMEYCDDRGESKAD